MTKALLALTAAIFLSGCTAMLVSDVQQRNVEYWTPLLANPELDVLDGKFWFGTPGVPNQERPLYFYEINEYPTEAEKKALKIYYGYAKGWQEIFNTTVNQYTRAYNDIWVAGNSAGNSLKIELIIGKLTYGEYALRMKMVADKQQEAALARDNQVMAQQAAAFSSYLYNQQLINAVNQPRTITPFSCRKVGHTYHCF